MKVKDWACKNVLSKIDKSFFTRKKIIIISAVLVLALILFFVLGGKKSGEKNSQSYLEVQASVMNISETITQSGVVQPYERYEITSLVRGEIIASPFEEGDYVEEGDTLYQIDDEDAQLNMEKAQMALDEANESVSKLNIYAATNGRLSDFSLEIGDNVNNGLIGKIINTDTLTVDIPFSNSDFNKISVGDSVTITSSLYMTSLPGKVVHKYYANADTGGEGSIFKNVEIEIKNPGALAEQTTFAATVHTKSGDVTSSGSGTIDGGTVSEVRAEVSGKVSYIGVKNGDYVSKGQLIARLTNNSIVNQQKSNSLSVKSNQKTLDQYNITAPISGTVITKTSKAGDKIDSSNSQTVMMVVADMSKMKFTITVDELDIADIKLGQTAIVDADALPNETFEARVTTIASEGVSSGDGVTTFSVELTIDEPGNLKSGMNVNASVLINEANGVIAIPEDALMSVRGQSATVLVKADKNSKSDKKPVNSEKNNENKNNSSGTDREGPQGKKPNNENFERMKKNSNIPDGYEIRQIIVGVSNGTMIEVVSGISEGETVAYIPSSATSQNSFMMGGMMGGMPGGMMGGMPGGMSGGRPQGANRTGGGMPGGNR